VEDLEHPNRALSVAGQSRDHALAVGRYLLPPGKDKMNLDASHVQRAMLEILESIH